MKIVLFTQNHEPGGGNKYLTDFIQAINSDFEITLVYNKNGLFKEDLQRLPIDLNIVQLDIDCDFTRLQNMDYTITKTLYKVLRKISFIRNRLIKVFSTNNKKIFSSFFLNKDFDIAIAFNGGFPAALACFDFLELAKQKGSITVMAIVSMPSKKRIQKIYQNTISKIDYYVVNCKAIQDELIYIYKISKDKFQIIYNCVDLPPVVNKIRTGIEEILRFGFVGRLEKQKGVKLLIKSFTKAIKLDNKISLFLYGRKGKNSILTRNLLSNKEKIIVKGPFESAANQVYPNIDILILPSFWEGFPYVIIEAMSFGIPVIASDVGGVSEIVNSNMNGCLIAKRNKQQLISSILEFSKNRKQLTLLGLNARKDIEQRFTSSVYKNKINQLISVLKNGINQ